MIIEKLFYSLPHDIRRNLYSHLRRGKFKQLQSEREINTNTGYSYKPFDQYHSIFVHIPKAAGVSICKTLFGNLCGGHTPITKYQIIFSKEDFDSYYKFTFVRNPWDRAFSAYTFLKNGGMTDGDKRWADTHLTTYNDFDEFIKKGLIKPSIHLSTHFKPQYKYLCLPYNQKLFVDFIGYFENIQNDFQIIKSKLSLNSDLELEHQNKTRTHQLDYKDFYSRETRDIVAEIYRTDIDLLGYNFDNSSLKSQLSSRNSYV